jgi:tetratricopeptide (TPR) repeat protein
MRRISNQKRGLGKSSNGSIKPALYSGFKPTAQFDLSGTILHSNQSVDLVSLKAMKLGPFIFIFLLPVWLFSQTTHIDNLRKILPLLNDSARIDSMNELSLQYIEQSVKDSAEYYATSAYNQSGALHYIHGLAESLSRQGNMQTYFFSNLIEAEKLDRASIELYQKTGNKAGLAPTYSQLAFACFGQSKYDEALKYSNECFALNKKNLDEAGMLDILGLITQIYLKSGEFVKSFNVAQMALQMATRGGTEVDIKGCLLGLGTVCMGIEDYSLALNYYRSVFQNFTAEDSISLLKSEDLVWAKMEYAEIYSHLNMFDSALYRYNLFDTSKVPEKDLRIFLVSKGEYFMLSGQYEKALPNLLKGLAIHFKLNDGNEIIRTVLDIANTYNGLHNENQALRFAWEGLDLGLKTRARQRMRDAYKLLYSVYDSRGVTDSAYFYYRSYIQTKQSLTDDQTKGKFAANEYVGKIELLNNEKLISQQRLKIQDQQLKKETLIRKILIAFVFAVLLISLLLLRNTLLKRRNEKLKNENIQRELEHKTIEMEMQALRAQMNPHFIFNCLNSINRFIMKNESQAASDYLTQFSRLIRLVLNNSKKAWIPLEDEIDMLRLYLDMEKLRFKDAFNYDLYCDKGVDPSGLFIPPLLLQPFVENAIWHGLMHKKENGLVTISFKVENDILHCTVIDNGVGRSAAASVGSKSSQAHKSMGIQITRERLALINGELNDEKVVLNIEDMIDKTGQASGTKVDLSIRFHQNYETQVESFPPLKLRNHD